MIFAETTMLQRKSYFRWMNETLLVTVAEMKEAFLSILRQLGFEEKKAERLAEVFTANSVDGVYTHGVNRFPVFVNYVKEGVVNKDAVPTLQAAFNGLEQWNGNLGPGPLNAIACTERAMELAQLYGIGCVALANTNHWMRGGYYGWQAAKEGFVFIGWTNTTALMPAWGAIDAKLGNNPLVMAMPYGDKAIVLDAAMSQYSFGSLQQSAMKGEKLSFAGGYDKEGDLTDDPSAILESRRALPIGYWKGAGLSLLLDILAAVLSGGLATHQIASLKKEYSLSQVFVCIDVSKLAHAPAIGQTIDAIIADYKTSVAEGDKEILYPGERVLRTRGKNTKDGIPVMQKIWSEIKGLL